jgi:hypothetical protein
LFGGTFEAGRRPGGGFRVLATFPLERRQPLPGDLAPAPGRSEGIVP